ncbi:hypothetical protein Poli38472_014440 [Pythium oligandrum]|uniref:Uncharacterized protein n=1 Tax=Pythium oligandrum TaxID=41045 RepID=A0A8K1C8B7_PYTOL|nr:hypothetical protein Poli38472_014440 [Pythium oligandrum]|eukprot:TMW57837.1 hypothetical protein Poli38472_014440 [Pythium oligandrum]
MGLHKWTLRFGHGVSAAVVGSARAATEPALKEVFWRKGKQLFLWSTVLIIVIHVTLLPVEWLLGLLLPASWIDTTFRSFRYAMNSTIPFAMVTICRYVKVELFEDAFFAGLKTRDKLVAESIRKHKAIYWDWEYVYHAVRLGARQLTLGLLVTLISPTFGAIVPLARFGYKIRRMERFFWIPVFLAFCFASTQDLALQIVRVWLNSRELFRDLYDPVIARLKSVKTDTSSSLNRQSSREWYDKGSGAVRLGFSMTFACLLQVPFVGPFAWFVAFVAAGIHAPEMINLSAFE